MEIDWISTKDKLPEHQSVENIKRVLCFLKVGKTEAIIIASLVKDEDGDLYWFENANTYYQFEYINYWHPLPEYP